MKLSYMKPREKRKVYPIRIEDVCVSRKKEWNSFSAAPEKGESWTRFSREEKKPNALI